MNKLNMYGNASLHIAAETGNLRMSEHLIKAGAFINITNGNGDTPLHLAVQNNKKDVVKFLLENGANINAKNMDKDAPIHLATCTEVAELLLEKGATIEAKNSDDLPPLIAAATNGCKDMVKFFLEKGANIEVKYEFGLNALCCASMLGHTDVVQLLLDKGAEINADVWATHRLFNALPLYNCSNRQSKHDLLIKYALLQNPHAKKVVEIQENYQLSTMWEDCKREINKRLGSSSVTLHRFLQETNEDILISYLSNESTGLQKELKSNTFKMYSSMITDQIRKAEKRKCVLHKSNIIMRQCSLKILPTEIKDKITEYLETSDLEIFTKAADNMPKRKNPYNGHLETALKKIKY